MIAGCPQLLRASCVNKVKSGHSDCYAVPTVLIRSDSQSCRCRLGSSRPRCCWWIDAALFTQLVNRSSGLYTFTAIGVLSLASPPTTYETPFMNPLRWSVFGGCPGAVAANPIVSTAGRSRTVVSKLTPLSFHRFSAFWS